MAETERHGEAIMRVRLVEVSHTPGAHYVGPIVLIVFAAAYVALTPFGIANVDLARAHMSPAAKVAVLAAGAVAAVFFIIFLAVQTVVSLGWVSVIYGIEESGKRVLADFWGLVGMPKHRLVLSDAPVRVRVETFESPVAWYVKHGPDVLHVSQDGRELHVGTMGRFDGESHDRLMAWLGSRGLEATREDLVIPRNRRR